MFIGAGCPTAGTTLELSSRPPEPPAVAPPSPSGDSPVTAVVAAKPYYVAYSADAVAGAQAEGRPVLLYFWAAWCPICRAEEPKLKALIETSAVPVAGFRVDIDTETELKSRFRVPYQHTTIILNARGEESVRFTGPVAEADLTSALEAAAK